MASSRHPRLRQPFRYQLPPAPFPRLLSTSSTLPLVSSPLNPSSLKRRPTEPWTVNPVDSEENGVTYPNKRHSFDCSRSSYDGYSFLRSTSNGDSSSSEDEGLQEVPLWLSLDNMLESDDWYESSALANGGLYPSQTDLTTTLDSLEICPPFGTAQLNEPTSAISQLDHPPSDPWSLSPESILLANNILGEDFIQNTTLPSINELFPRFEPYLPTLLDPLYFSETPQATSSTIEQGIQPIFGANETISTSIQEACTLAPMTNSHFGSDLATFARTFLPFGIDHNDSIRNIATGSSSYAGITVNHNSSNSSFNARWAHAVDNSPRGITTQTTPSESEHTRNSKAILSLLGSIESSEDTNREERTSTPEGMASHIKLYEYQMTGLAWLKSKETGTSRGGILGDDMGLGKTIQTISLIVSRPAEPIEQAVDWEYTSSDLPPEDVRMPIKATLVIVPLALVYQWGAEFARMTRPGHLKVFVYYGKDRFESGTRSKINPQTLSEYDVIITTTTSLKDDFCEDEESTPYGPLYMVKFHRVIIDEAHEIKNHRTKASRACAALAADYRWCLTGTPIQNNIGELFSLIRFLRIEPYCQWKEFHKTFLNNKTRSARAIFQRVQVLLKAICLRRTKNNKINNRPILVLPTRHIQKHAIEFSEDERAFYNTLNNRTQRQVNAYLRQGTITKNYSSMLQLLLRLRQACCHPHLIKDLEVIEQPQNVQDLLNSLVQSVIHRLLENDTEAVECPICMDVNDDSVILTKCGHAFCRDCITAHLSLQSKNVGPCPQCRTESSLLDFIPIKDFNQRFKPSSLAEHVSDEESEESQEALEKADQWLSSSKINRMVEIIVEAKAKGDKTVVFSQFTGFLTLMERPLREKGIEFLRYDGRMDAKSRNEAVQKMTNDPQYSVMLISLKCGATGLNLTAANHVILMDPWWNPAVGNQAIDRVHRIGQTKEVYVHQLCVEDTVEDRIINMQQRKQDLVNSALGEGGASQVAKLGANELLYLFRG